MSDEQAILNPPSDDPVDQVGYAVQAINEATVLIRRHYDEQTQWPGWPDEAALVVRLASRLLSMSAAEATT